MIYYHLNFLLPISLIAGAAWYPFYCVGEAWSQIVATIFILIMFVTNMAMMIIADRNVVWWPEVFLVRSGFSLYAGWLTVASLLSLSSMLKSWGMADEPSIEMPYVPEWDFMKPVMVLTEEEWAIVIVWSAEVFFEVVAWAERNPLYGSVFIWASSGIIAETLEVRPNNTNLITNIGVALGIHVISMITMIAYLIFEEFQPWYKPLSFWGGGLTGFTNWAEMLTDISYIFSEIEQFFSES